MGMGKVEHEFKKRMESSKISGADLIREVGINYIGFSKWLNGYGNIKEEDYNKLTEALTKLEAAKQINKE